MAKSVKKSELALVYIRVSSLRQAEEGLSLEAQERTLKAQAEADGYLVEVIREEGKSGKSVRNRPALLSALEKLNKGEASALYVTRLDRLARSLSDLLTIVSKIAIKNPDKFLLKKLVQDDESDFEEIEEHDTRITIFDNSKAIEY
jgi:DNA invertase Pin-like site-specific DNA recombinase